ncbi:Transcriptional adapter ada2 [Linderina pennispora]|nr:Transcriptional adapter ada2 [Linderina pennispora]
MYHCDNCQVNVSDSVRIRCHECEKFEEFDLCAACFAKGIEIGRHKKTHSYRIVTKHRFPIFTEDWSADEELLLIDGLRQFGMGNWRDAAEHVGTKTKEECEQHYKDVYVASEDWPMPDMNKTFGVKFARTAFEKRLKSNPNKNKVLSSQPSNHEIIGYMPGRLEFETEVENEAEQVVKDMVFNDDDSPEEVELKLIVLAIYNSRLDRRVRYKNFIFDRGLLEYRKTQAAEKKRPKDERDILTKSKVFARMQTREDFNELSTGLLNEQTLRHRIAQLQEWRRNGITTLEDGSQYEVERSQRLSRRANTLRDSAHLLERLHRIAAARAVRESGSEQHKAGHYHGARKPNQASPDIESAEGVELLTKSEKAMCQKLQVFPRPYLVVKETLLSEYARRGSLKRRQARELVKIDPATTNRIYDFLVDSGWIKTPEQAAEVLATAARAAAAKLASVDTTATAASADSAEPAAAAAAVPASAAASAAPAINGLAAASTVASTS